MKKVKAGNLIPMSVFFAFILFYLPLYAEDNNEPIKHLTFEGSLIEGQMGSLKALIVTSEKRPEFGPMALQLGGKQFKLKNINKSIIEENQYNEAFNVQLPD